MFTKTGRFALATAVLCILAATPARADSLLTGPGGGNMAGVEYGTPLELGFEFTVGAQNLSVTSLGVLALNYNGYIGVPLNQAHTVGLWTSSGTLLESVTVPAGGGTLVNGFYYVDLASPVAVSAGQSYVLGAYYPGSPNGGYYEDYLYVETKAEVQSIFSSDFTYDQGVYGYGSGFPANSAGSSAYVGPNLEFNAATVPEPSSLLTLCGGLGVIGAFFCLRRRHRLVDDCCRQLRRFRVF